MQEFEKKIQIFHNELLFYSKQKMHKSIDKYSSYIIQGTDRKDEITKNVYMTNTNGGTF